MKTGSDLVVIDLETNGRDGPDVRITQIGAVRLEKNTLKELSYFKTYVGMTQEDPPLLDRSIRITGITPETLKGWPTFHARGKIFSEWADRMGTEYIPTAWGTHFDIPVLRSEYLRCGMRFGLPGKSLCIKSLAYGFFWTRDINILRCGVSTALKVLGMQFEGHEHDALDDVRNECRILRAVLGVDPPSPTAQAKYGRFVKTEGNVPKEDIGKEDEKSPYD